MDRKVLLALYDKDQRIDVVLPEYYKEVTGGVVRFIGPPDRPGNNFIGYSRLRDEDIDQVIREQTAFFSRLGLPFEWKVYEHDSPPDLRERLMLHGFRPGKCDAIMVMNIHQPHSLIFEENGFDIRRLKTKEEVDEMIKLLSGTWQIDFQWLGKILIEDLWKRPEYCSVYIIYVDGVPASTGWVQFSPNSQFASLWGGTTDAQGTGDLDYIRHFSRFEPKKQLNADITF